MGADVIYIQAIALEALLNIIHSMDIRAMRMNDKQTLNDNFVDRRNKFCKTSLLLINGQK